MGIYDNRYKIFGLIVMLVSVIVIAVVLFFVLKGNGHNVKDKPPNIVIILGDDVGWNDVGFHGSNQIPTPNIDALAYNGVILNRFYTQAVCTPSRAALLTGYYPIRAGLQGLPLNDGQNYTLPIHFSLLPEKLKDLGYSTHLVGKWHLGFTNTSATPLARGFDTYFGYWTGFMTYRSHMRAVSNMTGFSLREGIRAAWEYQGRYITDVFTEKAIDIINDHNDESPFFLFLSHLAAHSNGTITEPKDIEQANKRFNYIESEERRLFADVVTDLDRSVGEVVNALEYNGILENTIILLFMDNGAEVRGYYPNGGSNWPLRGQKYTLFEGGVRGTAVLYSSKISNRSVISNELMHVTDVFPTLYEAAGGDVNTLGNLDGVSQWETLTKTKPSPRNEILINIDEVNGTSAIIGYGGKYKLVNGTFLNGSMDVYFGPSGRGQQSNSEYNFTEILESRTNRAFQSARLESLTESEIAELRQKLNLENCRDLVETIVDCTELCLFDLQQDPCETVDIKESYPEIVQNLSSQVEQYWREIVLQPGRYVDPNANPDRCSNSWFPWLDEHYEIYCTI
ncbi:arylsulfatase B-like [Agrilus planipennis]|uniref:Arylsulfatase B-like n=1 Tax=Agrilus planipennis TaxID=224129 RepID=A0A1W4WEL5_AGRPL|nr:arylsulfatase B-like [Agrilus planipennis]XP_018322398.1 arylsulfatase B-like [Agrilus planipennis]XP_018322399.1 arylsulfatase B-like [Agrilus planipennis]XP_018322400.1 arylsulfatase B-like [Agrilus planipennis]XP_018322401.1 arylsulfatase B-like [Agrilus planipennis]